LTVITAPGAEYSYSNIGYGILGLAVARAAGRPFMDLVTEQIFQPLAMATAGFRPTPLIQPHLATGYVVRRDGTIDPEPPAREHGGRGYKVPNGAVYASVYDLAKFIGAMSGVPPLLSDESRVEMLRIQTPENPARGYGLGFSIIIDSAGNRTAGHGGSVAGYNATMQFDPDAGIGVIILRAYNRGRTDLGRAARETVMELREALEPR
jgi:CubicO group peptidase (beta-lactamase class C family)